MRKRPSRGVDSLKPITSHNLRDHISQQILAAILDGRFQPGDRLIEMTIAEELAVSRAPVREALTALEREGIVVNVPRRGYSVIRFVGKDIEEIYSLRLLLEVGALRRAINRFEPDDIAHMQQIVDDLGLATQQRVSYDKIVTLDFAFHELICRVADHSRIYNAWNSMRLQTSLLISITSSTHRNNPSQPQELHQIVLNAIRTQDVDRAQAALTAHIEDAKKRAQEALGEQLALSPSGNDLGRLHDSAHKKLMAVEPLVTQFMNGGHVD